MLLFINQKLHKLSDQLHNTNKQHIAPLDICKIIALDKSIQLMAHVGVPESIMQIFYKLPSVRQVENEF
jgi:predicted amidohydrolase